MNKTVALPLPAGRPQVLTRKTIRVGGREIGLGMVAFFGAHVLLAVLIRYFNVVATAHAFTTILVALSWAASAHRRPERVAYIAAYIMGAEVLWRMSQALVFWETGKYAITAICIVALLRSGRLRRPGLPLAYFLLLLPSCMLTLNGLGLAEARGKISFNLSGHLALLASAWFFSHLKLSTAQIQRLFLAAIGPILGMGALTLFFYSQLAIVKFSASSKATSGGFGPNQVSALLGLGALLAFLCLVIGKLKPVYRTVLLGALVFLGVQSAMTFSRGGLYSAAGGALAAAVMLLKDGRARLRLILIAAVLFIAANFVVLPLLDSYTGGTISARFKDTNLTKRDDIVEADLQIWKDNLILGVGPGMGQFNRARLLGKDSPAHTEFTRLLAEHGIFGMVALLLFIIMGIQNFSRARTSQGKAVAASLMGWSLLFMLINAMRVAAPSFLFGLSFVTILPEGNKPHNQLPNRRPVGFDPGREPVVGLRLPPGRQ